MSETTRSRPDWMPDFCSAPVIGGLVMIVELLVAVIVIAPDRERPLPVLEDFLAASFLAQWIALVSAVVLCKSGPWLAPLPRQVSIGIAWLIPIGMSILGGYLLGLVDHSLALRLLPLSTTLSQFVLGVATLTALTATVVFRYFFVQERWKRELASQARAQLDALHARIRPHFLFNTLNTAASLVEFAPKQAERAILDLAELFRAALAPESRDWTLDEEVALTEKYLEIEKLRLGPRLRAKFEIDPAVLPRMLPQLCLQPLVENAIHHGIQKLPDGGVVEVAASLDAGKLLLTVRNPKPRLASSNAASNHIALGNIRDRLRLRFGPSASLEPIDQGDYYFVRMTIPEHRSDAPGPA